VELSDFTKELRYCCQTCPYVYKIDRKVCTAEAAAAAVLWKLELAGGESHDAWHHTCCHVPLQQQSVQLLLDCLGTQVDAAVYDLNSTPLAASC
jgi:hypothetical protein